MEKVGDVIELVKELLHINAYEAAKQINDIFQLGVNFGKVTPKYEIKKYESKKKLVKQFNQLCDECFQILCEYLHTLYNWSHFQDFNNKFFIEYLQNKDYIDYLIDEYFIYGSDEDKICFLQNEKTLIHNIKIKLLNKEEGERNNEYRII